MNLFRYFPWFGSPRSSAWPKVRDAHLERKHCCAACGRRDRLDVHHITPVFVDPSKELEPDNLITLCRATCHFLIGHLGYWKSYNKDVKQDAAALLEKIRNRPEA